MDKTYKTEWLKALRSGNYKQGDTFLNRDGKFCCLGVLCDLAEKKGELESHKEFIDEYDEYDDELCVSYSHDMEDFYNGYLPASFAHEIRISDREMFTLSDMNDGENRSFNEIAYWIEIHL